MKLDEFQQLGITVIVLYCKNPCNYVKYNIPIGLKITHRQFHVQFSVYAPGNSVSVDCGVVCKIPGNASHTSFILNFGRYTIYISDSLILHLQTNRVHISRPAKGESEPTSITIMVPMIGVELGDV